MNTAKDLKNTREKLNEANAILKDIAKENKENITSEIKKDIRGLAKLTNDVKSKVEKEGEQMKDNVLGQTKEFYKKSKEAFEDSKDKTLEKIEDIDKQAKKKPWYFIGGAAAIGAITGFFLSKRKKK